MLIPRYPGWGTADEGRVRKLGSVRGVSSLSMKYWSSHGHLQKWHTQSLPWTEDMGSVGAGASPGRAKSCC